MIPPDFFERAPEGLSELALRILEFLRQQGASFQTAIYQAAGGGFPNDTTEALWELTWVGLITNDTLHPLRSLLTRKDGKEGDRYGGARSYGPPGSPDFLRRMRARRTEGVGQERWSLVRQRMVNSVTSTEWIAAAAQQMLVRNGIVMRETGVAENARGGYAAVYPALKTMEESGWVRRGMHTELRYYVQKGTPQTVTWLRAIQKRLKTRSAVYSH